LVGRGLAGRDVAGDIFALLPGLEFEIRTIGSLAHDGELTPFHALDLGGLFKE